MVCLFVGPQHCAMTLQPMRVRQKQVSNEDMQKAEEAKYKAELEKFKADGGVIQPKVAAPV